MTRDDLRALIDQHVAQIREHVDSVRVFVTLDSDDGESNTIAIDAGSGNFYAQQGQIDEWLTIQRQYQKDWAIRKDAENLRDEDED